MYLPSCCAGEKHRRSSHLNLRLDRYTRAKSKTIDRDQANRCINFMNAFVIHLSCLFINKLKTMPLWKNKFKKNLSTFFIELIIDCNLQDLQYAVRINQNFNVSTKLKWHTKRRKLETFVVLTDSIYWIYPS